MTVTLVTYARFNRITRSEASAELVDEALADVIDRLQEVLDRPLESASRVERMYPARDGRLSPRAVPITAATGYVIEGDALVGGNVHPVAQFDLVNGYVGTLGVDVTYTGGWVERSGNPAAANRLPVVIEEDLCFAAAALLRGPQSSRTPAGAVSVSQGDQSVSYGPNGAPNASASGIRWSAATLRYRYRGNGRSDAGRGSWC